MLFRSHSQMRLPCWIQKRLSSLERQRGTVENIRSSHQPNIVTDLTGEDDDDDEIVDFSIHEDESHRRQSEGRKLGNFDEDLSRTNQAATAKTNATNMKDGKNALHMSSPLLDESEAVSYKVDITQPKKPTPLVFPKRVVPFEQTDAISQTKDGVILKVNTKARNNQIIVSDPSTSNNFVGTPQKQTLSKECGVKRQREAFISSSKRCGEGIQATIEACSTGITVIKEEKEVKSMMNRDEEASERKGKVNKIGRAHV